MHSRKLSRPAGRIPSTVLLGALLLALGASGVFAQEHIILNEVLADPASDWDGDGTVDFKGDEWIEVRNVGPEPIDLSVYYIRDGLGEDMDFRLSGILDPEGTAVFFGSDAVAWQTEMGLTTTGFSLNNGGDRIELNRPYDTAEGTGWELMWVIVYKDHEAEDDRSAGFNMEVGDWVLFDANDPYSGTLEPLGTGCAPTPGAANLCGGQVPLQRHSFGEMKLLFR
jgi:hypothetical protein